MRLSRENSQDLAVADRIHGAAIKLLRMVRVEDSHSGIGPAQLSALSVLVFQGEQSLRDLAATEQVRPSTMSRIVEALVTQNLARRAPGATDRRAVRITPTDKGKNLLLAGRDGRVRALAAKMMSLTREEKETLRKAAELIARL
jgi:DNA-binding MarR family transcriptional regulator